MVTVHFTGMHFEGLAHHAHGALDPLPPSEPEAITTESTRNVIAALAKEITTSPSSISFP
jgi:hypothetical protein